MAIVGQFGFGNVGDEGILLSVMDALGFENEYIVATPLPFTMVSDYHRKIPTTLDVRTLDDSRTDFDACIYGGGKVDWGFGWGYFVRAFNTEKIPAMAYGMAVRTEHVSWRLDNLYSDYLHLFKQVTVRDRASYGFLHSTLSVPAELTMCPAINLKEERVSCVQGAVAVCPRFGDYNENGEVDNSQQVEWIVKTLVERGISPANVLLIPFFPKDLEGHPRDLELCNEINRRLGGGCSFFHCDGFNARQVKFAISKCQHVISGGRYHAIVWAIAHGISYDIAPTVTGIALVKLKGLVEMHGMFGREKLLEMEGLNKKCFEGMF